MIVDRETWCIVFTAEPGPVPVGRRVAALLKRALRTHGLKCESVSDRTPEQQLAAARETIVALQAEVERLKRKRTRAVR